MELKTLNDVLGPAQRGHYAVGAFNFCNMETAQAIAEAGMALRSPVMYITAPWETSLLGPAAVVEVARCVARRANVPVCLHLDHATDVESVVECIEAGFPSVMIDASAHDFDENVRMTRAVVDMAHPAGITVEAELGAVGRVDDATVEGSNGSSLTDPDRAAEFVRLTGVDALAVAIGNAHGIYNQQPELDLKRLEEIRAAVDIPLVLHGGSGTPSDQLRRAIEIGISKVNVASELSRAYLNAVQRAVAQSDGKIWYVQAIIDAKKDISEIVERWMTTLGCAGKC